MKNFTRFFIFINIRITAFLFVLFLMLPNGPVYSQKVFSSEASYASYYIDATGNLYLMGFDQYNRMVLASTQSATKQAAQDSIPVKVEFPSGVTAWKAVAAGQAHALALGNDGNIYAWGSNTYGQLGNGSTKGDSMLVMVTKPAGVTGWTAVSAGAFHSYAIGDDGNLYAWGFNSFGQLGNNIADGSSSTLAHPLPVAVTKPASVTSWKLVTAGNNFGLAIADNDSLYSWGRNANGQLGRGNTTDKKVPTAVPFPIGVTKWSKVIAGSFFAMVLADDGNLYGFGQNNNGQIGDSTLTQRTSAVMVKKPAGVTAWTNEVNCGASFTVALANDNNLYAWGYGADGQLGNGTNVSNNNYPAKTVFPEGVTAISASAGHNHTMFVDNNNHLWACGRNSEGQLGIGALTSGKLLPLRVGVPASPVLLLPASGTIPGITDTAFVWSHVFNASSYSLQIASDSASFNNVVFEAKDLADTAFVITDALRAKLSYATKYFWRVNASSGFGSSAYSEAWSFITPNDPTPVVSIKTAKEDLNGDFKPDHKGETYKVTGVVTSIDYTASASGNNYYIQDSTAGVLLYSAKKLSSALSIGDSVMAKVRIDQYKGNTEFVAADTLVGPAGSVQILKTNARVPAPVEISFKDANSEKYEGSLVVIKGLYKISTSAAWPLASKNANMKVMNAAGQDTLILFIDADTDIDGTTEVTWPQDVVGILSQYSSSSIPNNGYELMPRSMADFSKSTVVSNVKSNKGIPSEYALDQNYPNPFNPATKISFDLRVDASVTLKVYSIIGREVATLAQNSHMSAGYQSLSFNAMSLPSGIYLYRLEVKGVDGSSFTGIKKMMLLK